MEIRHWGPRRGASPWRRRWHGVSTIAEGGKLGDEGNELVVAVYGKDLCLADNVVELVVRRIRVDQTWTFSLCLWLPPSSARTLPHAQLLIHPSKRSHHLPCRHQRLRHYWCFIFRPNSLVSPCHAMASAGDLNANTLCVCGFLLTFRFFICHMSYIQLTMGDNDGVLNGKGAKPKGQK